ncbi:hypothetical protein PEDI_33180 [Persicobacter diffluens]|uniref:HTH luxR-type domain-containing protein n=1 Tax=Persicobacter diffluens TaxID=981 RepID=A0AAN4VZ80_9BACT|nr:hypothetical protein PEDI_33180 [Persicobacter diffluens]
MIRTALTTFIFCLLPIFAHTAFAQDQTKSLLKNYALLEERLKAGARDSVWEVTSKLLEQAQTRAEYILAKKFLGDIKFFDREHESASLHYEYLLSLAREDFDGEILSVIGRGINDLGIIYYRNGELNKAQKAHFLSINWYAKAKDLNGLAYNYNNLGIIYKEKKLLDSAIISGEKALSYAITLEDTLGMGYNHLNLGITYSEFGDLGKALEEFFLALDFFEAVENQHTQCQTYGKISQIYLSVNDMVEAKKYLDLHMAHLDIEKHPSTHIRALRTQGQLHSKTGQLDSAFYYLNQCEQLAQSRPYSKLYISSLISIAFAHQKKGDIAQSKLYFNKALEKATDKFLGMEITCKSNLANYFLVEGKFKKAETLALEAYEKVPKANIKYEQRKTILKILYQTQKALARPLQALHYLELLQENRDTSKLENLPLDLAKLEFEYYQKQKDRENVLLREKEQIAYRSELKQAQLVQSTTLVITLFAIVLIIILYSFYHSKKRHNRLLQLKAEQLKIKNRQLDELHQKEKALMTQNLGEKDRHIAAMTMSQMEKLNALKKVQEKVVQLETVNEGGEVKNIQKMLKSTMSQEDQWDSFVHQFHGVHPEFFEKIKILYPALSLSDLKICAYIKIGMDNKSIAGVTNLSLNTIKNRIYRMKKKMELSPKDSIRDTIFGIS